jgi:hypothetical protein
MSRARGLRRFGDDDAPPALSNRLVRALSAPPPLLYLKESAGRTNRPARSVDKQADESARGCRHHDGRMRRPVILCAQTGPPSCKVTHTDRPRSSTAGKHHPNACCVETTARLQPAWLGKPALLGNALARPGGRGGGQRWHTLPTWAGLERRRRVQRVCQPEQRAPRRRQACDESRSEATDCMSGGGQATSCVGRRAGRLTASCC